MIYSNKYLKMISKIFDKFAIVFLPIYFLLYLIPRNNKIWVFGSNMGKSFGDNPKYFYLYVNSKKDRDVRPIWISKSDEIIETLTQNGYEAYSLYSFKGILYALKSGVYIFDHHTKDISFWLSNGAKKINLFHGIPLKKIHGDNKFDKVRNPSDLYNKIRWIVRRIQNEQPSHYYLATSKYVSNIFCRAFRTTINKGIISGYPRNDIFFPNDYLNDNGKLSVKNKELYHQLKIERSSGKKIITYMPTFRSTEYKFFDIVDLEALSQFLIKNNYILLVKAHPMSKLKDKFNNLIYDNIFNINSDEDPYIFLEMTDALITDYSSVYFDFLLKDKPIIFFPYDLEDYINGSRELYYNYEEVTPGYKVVNMDGLVEALSHVFIEDIYVESRINLLHIMFDYYDGKSSKTLYEKLLKLI